MVPSDNPADGTDTLTNSADYLSRRQLLKGSAGLALMALSGCSGGESGDSGSDGESGDSGSDGESGGSVSLSVATAPSGSSSFTAGQALSRALQEHSDTVSMSVQETDGWVANANLYDGGSFETVMMDNNTLSKAKSGEGPFENPIQMPMQGFQYTSLEIYFVARAGTGIESTSDLTSEHTVWPLQPGFGTRLITVELMKKSGLWDRVQINNVSVGDAAGATEEERIDVLAVYGANRVGLSGWAEQVGTRNDIHAIEISEEFKQTIEESPGARMVEFEPYGWSQEMTEVVDEVTSWALDGQYMFSDAISAETAYELARVSHEHIDTIREADSKYPDHSDPSMMTTSVVPDHPVHPGVAEFFKEENVWEDSWEEGEL